MPEVWREQSFQTRFFTASSQLFSAEPWSVLPLMDSNDGLRSLQLPTGNKRSGLSPFDEKGREAKKLRTRACDDAEQRVMPVGIEAPFPIIDLPLADPFYSYSGHFAESWGGNTAHRTLPIDFTNFDLGHRDQHGVLSCHGVGYGGNLGNQLETANADKQLGMDFMWDIPSQHPYQDYKNKFNNVPNGEVDLRCQFASIVDGGNPTSTHDAPEEINENDAGLHVVHSQVHATSSQGQLVPVLSQDSEVCYDYDTCLGVVSHVFSAVHYSL